MPMSSVVRRPAMRSFARTMRTGRSVSSRKMEEGSREGVGERIGRAELTWGYACFDEDDHAGDTARYSPMDNQSGSASLQFPFEGEGAHSAPTRMAAETANFLRSGICSLNIYLVVRYFFLCHSYLFLHTNMLTNGIGMIIITRSIMTSVIEYANNTRKVSTHSCFSVDRLAQLAAKCVPQAAAIVMGKARVQRMTIPMVSWEMMLKTEPRKMRR